MRENLRASLESDRAMVRDFYTIWGCYQELKRMIFRKSSKQPLPRSDVDEGNADFIHIPIFCTFLSPTYDNNFGGQICDHFGGKICGKFWWKTLWKFVVENFGVHAIFDILETPALKKYSICWVFEALFVVIVVFIFALSLSSQDVMSMSYLVISHNLHNTTGKNCELSLKIIKFIRESGEQKIVSSAEITCQCPI